MKGLGRVTAYCHSIAQKCRMQKGAGGGTGYLNQHNANERVIRQTRAEAFDKKFLGTLGVGWR